MASRSTYDVLALGPDRVLVQGSFRPQGSSALVDADTAPTRDGDRGFSVARSNTGLYTLTFADKYKDLESLTLSARVADGTPTIVQGGDYSAANRTLQVRVLQETAAVGGDDDTQFELADLADDVDNRISFLAVFRNTSLGGAAAT